jgi:hypothetical protein
MPNLSWRAERASMIAVAPHRAAPPEGAIHRASQSNSDADKPSRQGRFVVGLYEQVNVVALHRKVENPKPGPHRVLERRPDLEKDALLAQTRQTPRCAHRHVDRVVSRMLGPGVVPHPRAQCRLATGSMSSSAPSAKKEFALLGRAHESAMNM